MVSRILIMIIISMVTAAITIIVREEYNLKRGGAPPAVLNQTSICPCNKLLLSSLGPAAALQPKVMGVYTR